MLDPKTKTEIIVRTKVAYEIISDCHSKLCREVERNSEEDNKWCEQMSELIFDMIDMLTIMGELKRESPFDE